MFQGIFRLVLENEFFEICRQIQLKKIIVRKWQYIKSLASFTQRLFQIQMQNARNGASGQHTPVSEVKFGPTISYLIVLAGIVEINVFFGGLTAQKMSDKQRVLVRMSMLTQDSKIAYLIYAYKSYYSVVIFQLCSNSRFTTKAILHTLTFVITCASV